MLAMSFAFRCQQIVTTWLRWRISSGVSSVCFEVGQHRLAAPRRTRGPGTSGSRRECTRQLATREIAVSLAFCFRTRGLLFHQQFEQCLDRARVPVLLLQNASSTTSLAVQVEILERTSITTHSASEIIG